MAQRNAVEGVENVMEVYSNLRKNSPYYSLWYNTSKKVTEWGTDDDEAGQQHLRDTLTVFEQIGDTTMYYLNIHPGPSNCYKNTSEHTASIPLRLNPVRESYMMGMQRYAPQPPGPDMSEMLSAVKEMGRVLMEKIAKIELEVESDEPDTWDKISGIIEKPGVVDLIGKLLPMIGSFLPAGLSQRFAMAATPVLNGPAAAQSSTSAAQSSTSDDEAFWDRVQLAIDRLQASNLMSLDTDLSKLADLAENKPEVFKMCLNQLRSL